MSVSKRTCVYSRLDKEDPEEAFHRRARFLIYKVLKEADHSSRRKPSFLRVKLCRLKVKIGKRLRKLRRSLVVGVSAARAGVQRYFGGQLKGCGRLFGGGTGGAGLPSPLFTIEV